MYASPSIDYYIEELIDEMMAEDDGCNPRSLKPMDQQIAEKRAFYRKQLEMNWLKDRIQKAITCIKNKEYHLWSPLDIERFESELSTASKRLLNEESAPSEYDQHEYNHLGISFWFTEKLFEAAKKRFSESNHSDSAALFCLLSHLEPRSSDYFMCWGATEQKCQKFEIALKAFQTACELNSKNLRALYHAAECAIEKQEKHLASDYLELLHANSKHSSQATSEWTPLVNQLKTKINLL